MLDLILSYIFTVLVSLGIDLITLIDVTKVIFDNGYKFDFTNTSYKEISKTTSIAKIIRLIPLINIFDSLMMNFTIKNNKDSIIDNLSVHDMLEELTEEEKEKYNKKTNFFSAIAIMINSKKNSKNSEITRLKDGSFVYSKYVNGEINIDTIGPISELKNEEQIKVIIEEMQNTDTNSPLKDMLIEEEIIPKKSKLVLKLEKLRNDLKNHINELENEEKNNNQKIKKL